MGKLKIKDIPHLDLATANPVGGERFGVRESFSIDEGIFKAAGLIDFQADIKANPKRGEFDVEYGSLYGVVAAIGKNADVSLGGGVSL